MSWNYSSALSTDKDRVRFYIGDTDTADQLIQDEEITYLLSKRGDALEAAADAAEGIAAKYARQVDTTNGVLSVKAGDRRQHFLDLAAALRTRAESLSGASMTVGGISISDKLSHQTDPDEVQPFFRRGGDDYPSAVPNPEDPLR